MAVLGYLPKLKTGMGPAFGDFIWWLNEFISHFWVELREFLQNIYGFICVTSGSTKILEIENKKISVKSKFLSFFPILKTQLSQVIMSK